MYYPPAKFGDDMSSGFCFRVLTHIHTDTHICTDWTNTLLPQSVQVMPVIISDLRLHKILSSCPYISKFYYTDGRSQTP